ncbi:DNA repair protein SWI5 homolog [Pleurodeles waltl]|uniref:DNA repair protein SWI5 homolog n=1 Tax=Pleurodeles waltl TaxID=8319 RepID=UPI003709746A
MRASLGTQKTCHSSFKSPIQSPSGRGSGPGANREEALQCEIAELRRKDSDLDNEMQQLMAEGYRVDELDQHIALLHEYNDLKDVGQLLMGRLAVLRGVTTKDLYKEFDLDVED